MACFSEDLKCFGAWDTACGQKSERHPTIEGLEERGVERGSARRSSLKGQRAIVNQTSNRTVSEATFGKLLTDGLKRIIFVIGFSERVHVCVSSTELNELNQTQKGSNERLFILTRTHGMQIFGKSPLSSHKTTLKQQINGPKKNKKNERKRLISFGFSLYSLFGAWKIVSDF